MNPPGSKQSYLGAVKLEELVLWLCQHYIVISKSLGAISLPFFYDVQQSNDVMASHMYAGKAVALSR